MDYDDFELQIGPRDQDRYLLRVLGSPAGQGEGHLELPDAIVGSGSVGSSDHGHDRHVATTTPSPATLRPMPPTELGGSLFRALFAGQIGRLFHQSLNRVDGNASHGLRLRLRINPGDRTLASLHYLPWELLYREETEDFLALSRWTPVVRSLAIPRPVPVSRFDPPLRVLIVLSDEPAAQSLQLDRELADLEAALGRNGEISVEVLRKPDLRDLRRALAKAKAQVLHYMGHGGFDPATGEGTLALPGTDLGQWTSGRSLATKIKDSPNLRLVVLNACDTARSSAASDHSPFAGVATSLVLGGIPAVVAMQSPIIDRFAASFGSAFYERLAAGLPLEEAVTEGRHAIHALDPEGTQWAIPVLFLRTPTGDLLPRHRSSAPTPAPRSRPLTRPFLIAVGALGLSMMLATAGGVLKFPVPSVGWPENGATTSLHGETPAESSPDRSESAPNRTLNLGSGATRLSLELRFKSTDALAAADAFAEALSQAANRHLDLADETGALAGRAITIEVGEPSVRSITEAGLPWSSCQLTAASRVSGADPSSAVGTIFATRAAADRTAACVAAAEELAERVVLKLAHQHPEETP